MLLAQPGNEIAETPAKPSLTEPDRLGQLPERMKPTEMRNRDATKLGRLARAQHAMEGQVFWKTLDDLLSVVHAPRGAKPRDCIHTGYLALHFGDRVPRADKSLKRQCFEKVRIGPHFLTNLKRAATKSLLLTIGSRNERVLTPPKAIGPAVRAKAASAAPPRRTLYRFSSTDMEANVPYNPKKDSRDPRFIAALNAIRSEKFWTDLPNPWQIKVGRFNFYWTKGTITIDAGPKIYEKGLDAFIRLLKEDRDGNRRPAYGRERGFCQKVPEMPRNNSWDGANDKPTVYEISGITFEEPPEKPPFVFHGLDDEDPTPVIGSHRRAEDNDAPF